MTSLKETLNGNTNSSISDVLGIEYQKHPENEIVVLTPADDTALVSGDDTKNHIESDYELSRKTFKNLISMGNTAVNNLNDIARLTEHPRAYEVLSTLMRTVAETARDLTNLQKDIKDIRQTGSDPRVKNSGEEGSGGINIDKAVFVGSPSELLKEIKKRQ
jgi:hypothetical protein